MKISNVSEARVPGAQVVEGRSAACAEVAGVRVPRLIYGTAWKEGETARLTRLALEAGFRGIDTANQRRHYHEAAVGEALAAAVAERGIAREEVFVQTKFTNRASQDSRLPYDPLAAVSSQVAQSCESSLRHLGVDWVDAYLLHGPSKRHGLTTDDWETWQAMESLHHAGKARLLGVSNVSVEQLRELWTHGSVKPRLVQNRCYASRGWDRAVRTFCAEQGLLYQGFSLLTANAEVLHSPRVRAIAVHRGATAAQVVLRFALQLGLIALTGTSSAAHMAEDLAVFDFELDSVEVQEIENLAG